MLTAIHQTLRLIECSRDPTIDRKSTRLNSSHMSISYAVFCLKKKVVDGLPVEGTFAAHQVTLADRDGPRARSLHPVLSQLPVGGSISVLLRCLVLFFLGNGRPRSSPPFPSPTLFR